MRRIRVLLLGIGIVAVSGGMLLFSTSPSLAQREPVRRAEEQSYWRFHDGRWSHWDTRDRRWYYTDGSHWYYHNGKAWELYRFDKTFGRENFQKGGYVIPTEPARVVVPGHGVYVVPR
jgi:hypothetical protein